MGFAKLLKGLLSAVGVRLAGAGIGFVLQLLLARWLTPAEMGGWFLALSLGAFVGLLVGAGYPTLGLTVLARYHAQGREHMARAFLQKSAYDIGKYALVLCLFGMAFVLMAPVDTITRMAVVAGLLIAPASAMARLNSSAANALRRFLLTIVPDFIGKGLVLLLFVCGWMYFTGALTLDVVILAFVVLSFATAWVSGRLLGEHGITNWGKDTTSRRLGSTWASRAFPLVVVAMSLMAMADYLILVATMLLTKEQVAQVGIAIRLAALVGFFTQASQQFVLRDLAGALQSKDTSQARALLLKTNLAAGGVIFAATIAFVVLGKWLLGLFGPTYVAGYNLLLLLMVAQALRAMGGLNIHLLSLGGGQRKLGRACLASFVIVLAVASLLAPHLGVDAIGWAAIVGELVWIVGVAGLTRAHVGWRADILAVFSPDNKIGEKPLPTSQSLN